MKACEGLRMTVPIRHIVSGGVPDIPSRSARPTLWPSLAAILAPSQLLSVGCAIGALRRTRDGIGRSFTVAEVTYDHQGGRCGRRSSLGSALRARGQASLERCFAGPAEAHRSALGGSPRYRSRHQDFHRGRLRPRSADAVPDHDDGRAREGQSVRSVDGSESRQDRQAVGRGRDRHGVGGSSIRSAAFSF